MKRPELLRLAKPFPSQFVAQKEGASYVNHAIVQQRLLATVGPFDMRVDQVIRGPIADKVTGRGTNKERTWPGADNAVVGVVLTCTFTIDGERVEVSEVGTPEGYYMADHDGERLKKAMSDALKRCAMRVGVGLDLWSKGSYVLPSILEKDIGAEDKAPAPDHDAPDPDDVVDICDVCGEPEDGHSHEAPSSEAEPSGEGEQTSADEPSSPDTNPCKTCGPQPRTTKCPDCPGEDPASLAERAKAHAEGGERREKARGRIREAFSRLNTAGHTAYPGLHDRLESIVGGPPAESSWDGVSVKRLEALADDAERLVGELEGANA